MRHLMLERWRRDERGSIIIAVEVIMVITLISIAVVARKLSAQATVH
ncbi:MAG: hypothetical protein QOK20_2556, partial [Acidimicrobiaceae bacterium]|nr:hypothetical protein [Acidimicrobiaceae bacterium]